MRTNGAYDKAETTGALNLSRLAAIWRDASAKPRPVNRIPISSINAECLASGCDSAKFWARNNDVPSIRGGLVINHSLLTSRLSSLPRYFDDF